jgi:DNA-directed RNA polymerase subunit N (RpoN/RPB10)
MLIRELGLGKVVAQQYKEFSERLKLTSNNTFGIEGEQNDFNYSIG